MSGGWVDTPLRYIATSWCDGPFGSGLASEHYTEVGARVVRLQNIRPCCFDDDDAAFIDLDYFVNALSRHSVLPGDLLIAGLGDNNNLVGRACVAPAGLGPALVKADCFRFRLDAEKVDARFVAYSLSASADRAAGELSGGSTRSRINLGLMAGRKVLLPPLSEQVRIANFLDEQTARIDALIAEKTHLVEKLAELWAATVSFEVGCTNSIASQNWNKIALKHVAIARCDGPFGSALASVHYVDSGARVIRLQNIRFGEFDDSDAAYIDDDYFRRELSYHSVVEGDVLVAGLGDERNLVGRACVAPKFGGNALVKADCFRFRLNATRALPQFVALQLSAMATRDGGELATGSTRQRIPLTTAESRMLRLPSLLEQRAIVERLAMRRTKHDELVRHSLKHIDRLREYRSALISAAVTGQLDISTFKAAA